jgi:hypothetical protein
VERALIDADAAAPGWGGEEDEEDKGASPELAESMEVSGGVVLGFAIPSRQKPPRKNSGGRSVHAARTPPDRLGLVHLSA